MTNYIEFSAKIKEKYPEYKDVDDLVLAQKIVEKYPEYKEKVTFDEVKPEKKGVDLTPSGLYKKALAGALSPARAAIQGQSIPEAYTSGMEALEKFKPAGGIADMLFDIGVYSKIPMLKGGGLGKFVGDAALQGALPGALEGLKSDNLGGGAATGGTIAATLQTIPKIGGLLARGANKGVELAGRVGQIKPETLQQVIKPESKALEMTSDDASNQLLDITKQIRENFNRLRMDRGAKVDEAINALPADVKPFNVKDILNDITSTFDQYQLDRINPARQMAGGLESELVDLVNSATPVTKIDTSLLPTGIMDKNSYNKLLREAYKSNAGGKTIKHPTQGDIYMRGNGAGETIKKVGNDYEQLSLLPQIDEITEKSLFKGTEQPIPGKPNKIKAKDFDIYQGRANLHGNDVDTQIKVANTPQGKMFYLNEKPIDGVSGITPKGQPGDIDGLNNIITDAEEYFNSVSPLSLQGIKKVVGQMGKWGDETSRGYVEPITEQVYGKFADRLNQLSPDIAAANKAFSDLMKFKKNDTVAQILKGDLLSEGKLGGAPSALKSYKSSINKASGQANLKDLENLLVKEAGQQPFLNQIDDINAAMDLLKTENTGIGGLASIAKALLTRPVLAGARKANQLEIPQKLQTIQQLVAPIIEKAPMVTTKGITSLLFGNNQ